VLLPLGVVADNIGCLCRASIDILAGHGCGLPEYNAVWNNTLDMPKLIRPWPTAAAQPDPGAATLQGLLQAAAAGLHVQQFALYRGSAVGGLPLSLLRSGAHLAELYYMRATGL